MSSGLDVRLPFGDSAMPVEISSANLFGIFDPKPPAEIPDSATVIRDALDHPIGTPPLHKLIRKGQKVVIVTSDLTRPCPSDRLLPPVLETLEAAHVAREDILVVMALGLHRAMTEAEIRTAVGSDVFGRVEVINHEPKDTVWVGRTSAGTPVEIFKPVVNADVRICLGNIEFHYFVGYSGGAKAVLPGCASEATVTANHAMMVHPGAVAGRIEGNPVRADLEEAVAMLGVDFILNVLVDGEERIVGAGAGDVTAAHRQGCEVVSRRGKVPIPQAADIVLVSAGGYPKDVNLYQAQKALDNAAYAVREGGIIILVAQCREGCGNLTFKEWMRQGDSPQVLLDRIQERFVLGGHKAAAIARVAQKARIFLVAPSLSGTPLTGMQLYSDAQSALDAAIKEMGPKASVAVLPHGASVLPQIEPSV